MTNRLALESSPYLRQHSENPVDWYPWSAEAFLKAKAEDKPVLLSVGYAACHWCHVMAHESFEDVETANLMNRLFINIKVDREERPDVDGIYMQAVQAMTGRGGWPMTVALTPSGEPFWGGTYFPVVDRPGMPSFKRVLQSLSDAWTTRRDSVDKTADALRAMYANAMAVDATQETLAPEILERAFSTLAKQYDMTHGGFGRSPKFPQAMSLDFCLRWWSRSGNETSRDIALDSFVAMVRGGIYDQVGGGFHRYSVDDEWLVPHFEKMLYDNALLVRLGANLWQATGDGDVAKCVTDTIGWVLREMTAPSGGFYASLDADSEGHEGIFYVWSAAEIDALLGADAALARKAWGVSDGGNFEGRSILHVPLSLSEVATLINVSEQHVRDALARAAATLYDARSKRVAPGRDEKILAGWNGLMTRALAECARIFSRGDWLQAAERNGEFLRSEMTRGGRVMRVHMDGVSKVPGFLEDHAAVALAFIALHESTFSAHWLDEARHIATAMQKHFRDGNGVWFDTADDAEPLITRPRETMDNAVPAGTSLALELMLRLAEIDGDQSMAIAAVGQLSLAADSMAKWANGFGHLLGVADLALFGGVAVALVGNPKEDDFLALSRVVSEQYLPTLVMVGGAPGAGQVAGLLADRLAGAGMATAYVCRNFVCESPTSSSVELVKQLDHSRNGGRLD